MREFALILIAIWFVILANLGIVWLAVRIDMPWSIILATGALVADCGAATIVLSDGKVLG